ncbi:diacylglycerol kinase family protein [Dongia sp.]|uniref:diacylglycerol/lipid kinase family protein n=1 Tax=Dongia sp. TaxID=1977262 RepID=UPI0035B058C4
MVKIGVISNAHSKRNKISMREIHQLLAAHPQVKHHSFHHINELPGCLAELAEAGVTHLVVSGGDGTVLAVVSALLNNSPFQKPPCVSLLSAGMTNVIAHEVGQPGLPAAGLKQLVERVEAGEPGEVMERPVLSVDFGDDRVIERGFLVGGVGFYQGTQLVRRDIHSLGAKQTFAAKLGIAWSILKILAFGPGPRSGFHGESIGFTIDGRYERRDCFMFLASTLNSVLPGVAPFWGDGPGRLKLTSIDSPPRRFARAALAVLRGKPRPWMAEAGYISRRMEKLELEMSTPVMIDGECFEPPANGRVVISAGPVMRFHRF